MRERERERAREREREGAREREREREDREREERERERERLSLVHTFIHEAYSLRHTVAAGRTGPQCTHRCQTTTNM